MKETSKDSQAISYWSLSYFSNQLIQTLPTCHSPTKGLLADYPSGLWELADCPSGLWDLPDYPSGLWELAGNPLLVAIN